jgi:hypothetical protein
MWRTASDFFVFLGWAWQNFTIVFGKVFLPVRFIYVFLKEFIANAFGAPIAPATGIAWDNNVLTIFNSMPYFHELIFGLVVCVVLLMVIFLLKQFIQT